MTDEAKAARHEYCRKYQRAWAKRNREKKNAYQRRWAKNNPDKIKAIYERFWEKQARMKAQALKGGGADDAADSV